MPKYYSLLELEEGKNYIRFFNNMFIYQRKGDKLYVKEFGRKWREYSKDFKELNPSIKYFHEFTGKIDPLEV